jgi:hypothetical protein
MTAGRLSPMVAIVKAHPRGKMMDDAELRGELAVLKVEVEANRWFTLALMIELLRKGIVSAPDLIDLNKKVAAFLSAFSGKNVSEAVFCNVKWLRTFENVDRISPEEIMAAYLLMLSNAGVDRKDALHSWLQQADHTEIAADLQSIFEDIAQRFRRSPSGSAD